MAVKVMVSAPLQSPFGSADGGHVGVRIDADHEIGGAGVAPGHLSIGVIHVAHVVVQADGGEAGALVDGLVGDVRDHGGVVYGRHRDGDGGHVGVGGAVVGRVGEGDSPLKSAAGGR